MSAFLAALAAVLLLLGAAEAWGTWGERLIVRFRARIRRAASARGLDRVLGRVGGGARERLAQAGLLDRVSPRLLALGRAVCALAAAPAAISAAPVAPGRTGLLVAVGVPAAAALLPDLLVARAARRRRRRIAEALPDAIELMAVSAGTGRSQRALLAEAARNGAGPLREELGTVTAALAAGRPQGPTLAALERSPGGDLAALAIQLERSRRLGSPLARGLHEQAAAIRERQARLIAEDAARAAPKIQLVVALLLVPSVLLIVAAAILANLDALFIGL